MLGWILLGLCGLLLLRAVSQVLLVFIAHEIHRINGYPDAPRRVTSPQVRSRPHLRVLKGGRS